MPNAQPTLWIYSIEDPCLLVAFICAKTRFKKFATLYAQFFLLIRVITVNLTLRGVLPGFSVDNADDYMTYLIVPFICQTMFLPVHHLVTLLILTPLLVMGQYFMALAYAEIDQQLGKEF